MKRSIEVFIKLYVFMAIFAFNVQPLHAFPAVVTKVTDGDSIVVQTPQGEVRKVRLYGIDCPESKQPYGVAATDIVKELAAGKVVDVEEIGQDRYKRVVAIVTLPDGTTLQDALIHSGLAWVYPRYCKRKKMCDRWKTLQQATHRNRAGLWQSHNPMAPWDWCKGKR